MPYADTRVNGHYVFLMEGIRPGPTAAPNRAAYRGLPGDWNTDKAAEYFAVNKSLSAVTTYDYDWYGTTPSPGIQFVMDFDNDGSQDGILVGDEDRPQPGRLAHRQLEGRVPGHRRPLQHRRLGIAATTAR